MVAYINNISANIKYFLFIRNKIEYLHVECFLHLYIYFILFIIYIMDIKYKKTKHKITSKSNLKSLNTLLNTNNNTYWLHMLVISSNIIMLLLV